MRLCVFLLICVCVLGGCQPGDSFELKAYQETPQTQPATLPATTQAQEQIAQPPNTQPESQPDQTAAKIVRPFPGIVVDAAKGVVEIQAWVCLDSGYLEQVACGLDSREHESLMVVKVKPSQVHAAMLMAGLEPGSPGKWTYENNTLGTIAPRGDRLQIAVRYADPGQSGRTVERPVREWIRDDDSDKKFPDEPWVFTGSVMRPNEPYMGPGEHYVADMTGSIIGLVTFGDEAVGFSRVFADQDAVQAAEWVVNTDTIPPMHTEVTIILRRAPAR